MNKQKWQALDTVKLDEIKSLFQATYPQDEYGTLAADITEYWLDLLKKSWDEKSQDLKSLDLSYDPTDPLSRVSQKTTVITYADSISRVGEKSLKTLDEFLKTWFPSIGGLHILPACTVVEDRFNDGYFSQVVRDSIHENFGSNEFFADLVHRYFSMNDLVMGHVDIENPAFKAYLAGDDKAGKTFYTFTIKEYEDLKAAGSFDKVFRPRPFPLFTIFRRLPVDEPFRSMSLSDRLETMKNILKEETDLDVSPAVIGILFLYAKVLNDQMLLDEDVKFISNFIDWIEAKEIDLEKIFRKSTTQEVQHTPYIFVEDVDSRQKLIELAGCSPENAAAVAKVFEEHHWKVLGEEVRALTTFSHVQVDVNTTTLEGLMRFADDLAWYLTKDLNMLRLDAVNYAFKKWGTSCFGLPELDQLMQIVYLSMECICPRMIPNLEVNDSLTTILKQMTAETAAPPMMHAFHLASLLPAVFHQKDPSILQRIFDKIDEYDVPKDSIRFSLSESHDGKSVRGSMDLLEFEERRVLTESVLANGGYVKYKSIPPQLSTADDLGKYCDETGINSEKVAGLLFHDSDNDGNFKLREDFQTVDAILKLMSDAGLKADPKTSSFFFTRILEGRDPYELCITTRDIFPAMSDTKLEAERFLAFETLAFAVMGRNVKTIYFNDLLGLPNDFERVMKSGELRDIKRTKVDYDAILPELNDSSSFTSMVAKGINSLIGLVDSDPSLHFRGEEAQIINLGAAVPVAVVANRCGTERSFTLVNLSEKNVAISAALPTDLAELTDSFTGDKKALNSGVLDVTLAPFGRLWLKN